MPERFGANFFLFHRAPLIIMNPEVSDSKSKIFSFSFFFTDYPSPDGLHRRIGYEAFNIGLLMIVALIFLPVRFLLTLKAIDNRWIGEEKKT